MIVKSALIFLGIVDFFCNAYERILGWVTSVKEKEAISTSLKDSAEPSYLIQ